MRPRESKDKFKKIDLRSLFQWNFARKIYELSSMHVFTQHLVAEDRKNL